MTTTPNRHTPAVSTLKLYECGHRDTVEKVIGEPPYTVQIPSQGGRLCPACFLHSIHEEQFLEHEHRLNLGKIEETPPYDVWFSMLLRQRQVLRYEAQIRSYTSLSEAGQDQVLTQYLASVRSISTHYPCKVWRAFNVSHEPAYQEMENAFIRSLLHVQLSSAPIPTCDCAITLKVVDLTPFVQGRAEPIPLPTLDAWHAASHGRPLVVICHKTLLGRIYGGGGYIRQLKDERVGYLIEDPATLHFLRQATGKEFLKNIWVEGQLQHVYEEWPIYRIDAPHVIEERSFLVKPSFSRFGLSWCFHPTTMPGMRPVEWIDDLWDYGAIPDHLQFATDIRIDGTQGSFPPMHHVEDHPLCLYCAQPIDLSLVSTLGAGAPDCCAGCDSALRGVPSPLLYVQRVRRRQMKPLSPLGPTPALCNCLHHQAAQCTQKKYGHAHEFRPCSCACHTDVSGQPIGEEDWHNARKEWEGRRKEWFNREDRSSS